MQKGKQVFQTVLVDEYQAEVGDTHFTEWDLYASLGVHDGIGWLSWRVMGELQSGYQNTGTHPKIHNFLQRSFTCGM